MYSCSVPQDRVLINRLDSLCTLVLTGQWPAGRRYTAENQLTSASDEQGGGDELSYSRLMRDRKSVV